jgi:hypothetical protein
MHLYFSKFINLFKVVKWLTSLGYKNALPFTVCSTASNQTRDQDSQHMKIKIHTIACDKISYSRILRIGYRPTYIDPSHHKSLKNTHTHISLRNFQSMGLSTFVSRKATTYHKTKNSNLSTTIVLIIIGSIFLIAVITGVLKQLYCVDSFSEAHKSHSFRDAGYQLYWLSLHRVSRDAPLYVSRKMSR